jgi:Helix-turn-helix domain
LTALDRWSWCDLIASKYGPTDPSTRLVLLVISLHMNAQGESAWPSQEHVAERAALSVRSVREHLKRAERAGWISVMQRRQVGRAWFVSEYRPAIPAALQHLIKGKSNGARHPAEIAASRADARQSTTRRPAIRALTPGNLRHDARQNLPTNSSGTIHSIVQERLCETQVTEEERQRRDAQSERLRAERETEEARKKAEASELYRAAGPERVRKVAALPDFQSLSDEEVGKMANVPPEIVQQVRSGSVLTESAA